MTMQKPRFFLGAYPVRAMLEALSIGVVLLVILAVLGNQPFGLVRRPIPVSFLQAAFTFVGAPFCMLWLAARLRRFTLPRWQRYPLLLLLAAVLSLILSYLGQEGSRYLLQDSDVWK